MLDARTRHGAVVDRAELLTLLRAARHHSRRTGLTCHVVTGEPKVGRTSLLAAVCRATPSHPGRSARIACSRHANRLVAALADSLLHLASERRPAEAGDVERAAARLRADLRPGGSRARESAGEGGPVGLPDLVEALTRDAPLVIALDDIDQAGPASLVRLRGVLRDVAHLPVTVVASTRSGEPPVAPAELADLLLGARTFTLPGLSAREAGALLHERLGRRSDADLVATCHRITAGNPFMLGAVCDWILARDPSAHAPSDPREAVVPSVAEAVVGRAHRVDPRARGVAEAIAVATTSGEADPALVAGLSGTSLEDTLATLDLLVRMRLVTDDRAVALRHPLLAASLLGSMTVMSCNAAHLAAATLLHRRRDAGQRPARHLAASTVPLGTPWSVTAMITAARSPDTTAEDRVRYLEYAAQSEDAWPRVSPELAAARIALDRRSGLRAAVEILGHTADPGVRRRLLGLVGATLCEGDRRDDERAVLEAVRDAVAGTDREDWPRAYLAHGRTMEPAPTGDAPAARARSCDTPRPPGAVAVGAHSSYLLGGAPAAALADAREALDHGLDDLLLYPPALPAALSVLVGCGHQAEALTRRRGLVDDLERLPRWVRAEVELTEAAGHYAAGDLTATRQVLTERLAGARGRDGHGYGRLRTRLVGLLANVLLDLGDAAGAEALLRRHDQDDRVPPAWHDADMPLARARLRVRAGDLAGGAEELWGIVRRREAAGASGPGTLCWRSEGALLLAQTGAREEAVRDARRHVEFAEGIGAPLERARALRVRGALSGEPAAVELLESALDLLQGSGHDLETARTTAELGTVLARLGRHREAVAALSRAAGLAAERGARDLADRVRLQLVALEGRAPQDVSVRGILSLTPREREILIDALLGQPNKAIAGNRHITRRTVELHLSSAYRKLGISGRGEFGKILGNPGRWEILVGGA